MTRTFLVVGAVLVGVKLVMGLFSGTPDKTPPPPCTHIDKVIETYGTRHVERYGRGILKVLGERGDVALVVLDRYPELFEACRDMVGDLKAVDLIDRYSCRPNFNERLSELGTRKMAEVIGTMTPLNISLVLEDAANLKYVEAYGATDAPLYLAVYGVVCGPCWTSAV